MSAAQSAARDPVLGPPTAYHSVLPPLTQRPSTSARAKMTVPIECVNTLVSEMVWPECPPAAASHTLSRLVASSHATLTVSMCMNFLVGQCTFSCTLPQYECDDVVPDTSELPRPWMNRHVPRLASARPRVRASRRPAASVSSATRRYHGWVNSGCGSPSSSGSPSIRRRRVPDTELSMSCATPVSSGHSSAEPSTAVGAVKDGASATASIVCTSKMSATKPSPTNCVRPSESPPAMEQKTYTSPAQEMVTSESRLSAQRPVA
mmetsp:Transcript_14430/g.50178  ORF Transcript_14430/g.50178 Transcript_14430/m.50178 type:complete len:263 (+) Transcript_14430:785-1573(+)